ncbi:MAG: heparan-alpha-glucosaminide N-acetyltransferase domain-containing protein [Spirochaetes bacterium]|nr:heparan-alpha-glucosaminide N-acetyltransferase domain-containing protein [Spirochaetota bacterium]
MRSAQSNAAAAERAPVGAGPRDLAIDRFRGLAILLMVIANFLMHVRAVPPWLKHAPDVGLTVVDFIAPGFIFAIGLTFPGSVRRRLSRDGGRRMVEHVVGRAMALVGIGTLFSIGEWRFGLGGGGLPWGTLQSIGVAILLALPALFLPVPARIAAALAGLAVYQWALDSFWLAEVVVSANAGLQGSLSWALLLIMSTVFADLRAEKRTGWYLVVAVLMLAAGIAAAAFIPVSKHRMSLSFVLIVASSSALVFQLFDLTRTWFGTRGRLLATWGGNPLALYIAHFFLLAVFLVPPVPWWHVEAPLWLAAVQGAAFVAVLHALASWLRRRNVIISL